MRRMVVDMLALAAVLGGVGIALAQQSPGQQPRQPGQPPPQGGKAPPEKSKLEEMLAEALRNNPDIRVAAAKAAEADAELNRARLQVTQKVVALYYAIETQKKVVEHEEIKFKRAEKLRVSNLLSAEEYTEFKQAVTLAKAKLAELESQVPALLGKVDRAAEVERLREELKKLAAENEEIFRGALQPPGQIQELPKPYDERSLKLYFEKLSNPSRPVGPQAEKIRKALEKPVRVNFKETPFSDVLKELEKLAPGLIFRDWMSQYKDKPTITLHFNDPVPMSTLLQAIEDYYLPGTNLHGIRFVVREYGILVAHQAHLPPGAVTVQEFMRQPLASSDKPQGAKPGAAENRPSPVEGRVENINGELVRIDLGVKDGVKAGDIVEVFRLDPKPTFLGKLVIVESLARSAVGKPQGRLAAPIQAGDRVRSRNPRPMIQFQSHTEEKPGD